MLEKLNILTLIFVHDRMSRRDDRGATAVEYAFLASLIAAVIAAVVGLVGQDVLAAFTRVESGFR